jgi:hypothetical protein
MGARGIPFIFLHMHIGKAAPHLKMRHIWFLLMPELMWSSVSSDMSGGMHVGHVNICTNSKSPERSREIGFM